MEMTVVIPVIMGELRMVPKNLERTLGEVEI